MEILSSVVRKCQNPLARFKFLRFFIINQDSWCPVVIIFMFYKSKQLKLRFYLTLDEKKNINFISTDLYLTKKKKIQCH